MPQNFPTCTFLGNLRVSLFGIKTVISAKDKEKRKNIMLQLKVDTRFIDKKLILGIKQLLEEAYLFKFLTFLAPSEAPLCMQIIIFTYL